MTHYQTSKTVTIRFQKINLFLVWMGFKLRQSVSTCLPLKKLHEEAEPLPCGCCSNVQCYTVFERAVLPSASFANATIVAKLLPLFLGAPRFTVWLFMTVLLMEVVVLYILKQWVQEDFRLLFHEFHKVLEFSSPVGLL